MRKSLRGSKGSQAGNTMLEFAMVLPVLIPLLMGTIGFGYNLSQSIQAVQVVRDAGHMFVRAIDFSEMGNKKILARLAIGLGMTETAGKGIVILSKITYIDESDCTAAGLTTAQCTNMNHHVVVQRQVVGNPLLKASEFGSPGGSSLDAHGNAKDVLKDGTLQADGFAKRLKLESGQFAYVSEGYFKGIALKLGTLGLSEDLSGLAIY